MEGNIHRAFSTEMMRYFDVREPVRNEIVEIDYHQDDYYFKSLAHFYPSSKKVLLGAIDDYREEPSDETLGKCLHYIVDLCTPFHYVKSFSPGILVHHRAFEAIGSTLLRDKMRNIIHGTILKMPDPDRIDIREQIERVEELQMRRFLKFIRVFNALRGLKGLRDLSRGLNVRKLLTFILDPGEAFWELVMYIEKKDLKDPSNDLNAYYLEIKRWDIDRIERELARILDEAGKHGSPQLVRDSSSRVELLLIQWINRYYYDCIEMAVPLAYKVLAMSFEPLPKEKFGDPTGHGA